MSSKKLPDYEFLENKIVSFPANSGGINNIVYLSVYTIKCKELDFLTVYHHFGKLSREKYNECNKHDRMPIFRLLSKYTEKKMFGRSNVIFTFVEWVPDEGALSEEEMDDGINSVIDEDEIVEEKIIVPSPFDGVCENDSVFAFDDIPVKRELKFLPLTQYERDFLILNQRPII